MKFVNASETLFARTAKELRKLLSQRCVVLSCDFNFKEATARTFGHSNLRAFKKAVDDSTAVPSPWDEELQRADLDERRRNQAANFKTYANELDLQLADVDDLIAAWQPSAKRPQNPVIPTDELESLNAEGAPAKALYLIEKLIVQGLEPHQDDFELIRRGFKCSSEKIQLLLLQEIGRLGTRLVNAQGGKKAEIGVKLLEMIAENADFYVQVSLAKALFNGCGTPQNLNRAKSLCLVVQRKLDDGDRFLSPSAHIEFLDLQRRLFFISRDFDERMIAFNATRKAHDLGLPEAALDMAAYYRPLKPGESPDEYYGIVEPNAVMEKEYLDIAVTRGWDPDTNTIKRRPL